MTDYFKLLGLEHDLALKEETVRQAFRELSKTAHPDSGGSEDRFAELKSAATALASPTQRARHWLQLRGMTAEIRGTIEPSLMDLFEIVGKISQGAEVIIRRRDEAKSSLARAMMETETLRSRDSVENAIAMVDREIEAHCANFPADESELHLEAISRSIRSLAFLEKWRIGLRSCYVRLL